MRKQKSKEEKCFVPSHTLRGDRRGVTPRPPGSELCPPPRTVTWPGATPETGFSGDPRVLFIQGGRLSRKPEAPQAGHLQQLEITRLLSWVPTRAPPAHPARLPESDPPVVLLNAREAFLMCQALS